MNRTSKKTQQAKARKISFSQGSMKSQGGSKHQKFSSKGFWFVFFTTKSDVKLICWANDSFFNVLFGDLSDEGILDLQLFRGWKN